MTIVRTFLIIQGMNISGLQKLLMAGVGNEIKFDACLVQKGLVG